MRRTLKTLSAVALLAGPLLLSGCVTLDRADRTRGPRASQGQDKVLVCHRGRTLEVARPALSAHLRHGDYRGRCR